MQIPEIGTRYRHYKNLKEYIILSIALHTETQEFLVVYQGQYDDPEFGPKPIFARPLAMFTETIEHEGKQVQRFTKLEQ